MYRIGGAALALLLLVGVTGCGGDDQEADPAPEESVSSTDETVEPEEQPDTPSDDLTFEAGDALDPGQVVQWGDSMIGNDDYTVREADDGSGSWSYTHVASGCHVGFLQTRVPDLDETVGDSALSDEFLAYQLDQPEDAMANEAVDASVAFGFTGEGAMEMRSLSVERGSGTREIYAVRAFGALDAALMTIISCPDSDPSEVRDTIREDLSALIG